MKRRIFSVVMTCILALSVIFPTINESYTGAEAIAASAWYSLLYPENWEPGYSTADGLFLHDYSYAGYKLGEEQIPDTMGGLFIDVTKSPYNADSTGANDSTQAIQSAIDAVEAAGGGTVYLPEGTFKIKPQGSNTYALRISSSNVLLKGAGDGKTYIRGFKESMRNSSLILVQPKSYTSWDNDSGTVWKLSQDVSDKDTSVLHLQNTSGLNAGDWVIVRTDRTQSWIDEMGMGGYWSPSYNYAVTFYRQIKEVNASNNTITIDIPTKYAMKVRDNARVYKCTPNLQNVGLQDFSIGNTDASVSVLSLMENNSTLATCGIEKTGSWSVFKTFEGTKFHLTAGTHTLKLYATGGRYNLDYVDLVSISVDQAPETTEEDVNKDNFIEFGSEEF